MRWWATGRSGVVRDCLAVGQLIVIATDAEILLGVLFTSEKSQAVAPPVLAMLAAWPGGADAYVYGPSVSIRPRAVRA